MQNAVPHWAFELNSATAAAETGDLKGQILRPGRMWSSITLMHHLWIQPEGNEHLQVGWHIWSIQDQMFRFNYHSCPTFLIFHEFIGLVINCVKVWDVHKPN
jgi:hypothetical protein